jgi:hypothetical protein
MRHVASGLKQPGQAAVHNFPFDWEVALFPRHGRRPLANPATEGSTRCDPDRAKSRHACRDWAAGPACVLNVLRCRCWSSLRIFFSWGLLLMLPKDTHESFLCVLRRRTS